MQVNTADMASATGFSAGTINTVAAGTNGAIVLTDSLTSTSLTANATATAGALEGSTSDTSIALTSTALSAVSVTSAANANLAILAVDRALDTINSNRASLGALQNRFEGAINATESQIENNSAAREESSTLTLRKKLPN